MSDDHPIFRLIEIMAQLRDPQSGCPWDREQNFASISRYTIEEAYEVAEAITQNDMAELKSELGDLLFQVVFHAQMADEQGHFNFADVAAVIAEKMLRRHPHIFGEKASLGAADVSTQWEAIKAQERAAKHHTSLLDDVPHALPALIRAEKLQKRAAQAGFDWDDDRPIIDKIHEELGEVQQAGNKAEQEEEIGDLIFACVNLARYYGVDPETALRQANQKFDKRFRHIESRCNPSKTSLEEMERY